MGTVRHHVALQIRKKKLQETAPSKNYSYWSGVGGGVEWERFTCLELSRWAQDVRTQLFQVCGRFYKSVFGVYCL